MNTLKKEILAQKGNSNPLPLFQKGVFSTTVMSRDLEEGGKRKKKVFFLFFIFFFTLVSRMSSGSAPDVKPVNHFLVDLLTRSYKGSFSQCSVLSQEWRQSHYVSILTLKSP